MKYTILILWSFCAICSMAQNPSEKAVRPVRYADFGAKGDGQADDIEAIAAAHAYANQHGLPVRADDNATYYIGGRKRTVIIQTSSSSTTLERRIVLHRFS
jgi:hypothetical protein